MDITPTIIADFRANKPGFGDAQAYTDDMVTFALEEGDAETGGRGWGAYAVDHRNMKRRGMYTYAAHWLTVMYPNGGGDETAAAAGAAQGVQQKTVADESVTYVVGDTSKIKATDVEFMSTVYGQQFIRLRKRAGMGARAV